jgi:hypothetical protein
MLALHWTASRTVVRNSACERDEKYIERRFEVHNSACTEDSCSLSVLENIVIRAVQTELHESPEIILISTFGDRAPQ